MRKEYHSPSIPSSGTESSERHIIDETSSEKVVIIDSLTEEEKSEKVENSVERINQFFHDDFDDANKQSFEANFFFPERNLIECECSKSEFALMHDAHHRLLGNPNLFVGKGNYATVYDFKENNPQYCLKHIWVEVSVEIKDKNYSKLPARYQNLRGVQEYLDVVKEERRKRSAKGYVFNVQNSPLQEAGISNAVSDHLFAEGYGRIVPVIDQVYIYSNEVEGTSHGLPYAVTDKVAMLVMERVPGLSIEDLILSGDNMVDFLNTVDINAFEEKLVGALEETHKIGVVHQDITNRNIMINFETGEPAIIDFGGATASSMNRIIEPEKEIQDARNVCEWLREFKNDPSVTREKLRQVLKN